MGKTFTGIFMFFLPLMSVNWFKKGNQVRTFQSTNINYKLYEGQKYLYDHYHSVSRSKT